MVKIRQNHPLAPITWFKVGGNAEYFAKPSNIEELQQVIQKFEKFNIIGNTSNLLISDSGLPGCTIKLGAGFGKIKQISEAKFECGAACLDSTVAKFMQEGGVSGMEFLATIPGTIGGNIAMNAGCFGSEIFDILYSITILTANNKVQTLQRSELSPAYRKGNLPKGCVVLSAVLEGKLASKEGIAKKMEELVQKRLASQPVNVRTGGSTFKNPEGHCAWQLIQQAGAHKFKVGRAEVSSVHSNFLINAGGATAQDIFTLGEKIKTAVHKTSGIILEWEIKRLGVF